MTVFNLCLTFLFVFGYSDLTNCLVVTEHCTCSGIRNNCTCTGLQYIPVLPNTTTGLNLDSNFFPHLRRETFQNVSSIQLRRLTLGNNHIESIDFDAFIKLTFLESIRITNEKYANIDDLKASFQSLTFQHLLHLALENNKWRWIPPDMFHHLRKAKYLSFISLRGNKLKELNSSLFIGLFSLKKISCAENSVADVITSDFGTVEYLDLSNNNIYQVPKFCDDKTGKTTVPSLKTLSLSKNAIRDLSMDSFKCLNTLQRLFLDGNRMERLDNNILALLKNLKDLSVRHLSQIKIISDNAFNSSSLQKLKFSYNNYRFDRSNNYNITKIFNSFPNLKELDLAYNLMRNLNDTTMLKLFGNLDHLRKLSLGETSRITIPAGLLQKMPKLRTLNLNGNRIGHLDASIFVNMTSLKELNIAENQIHVINETSFPPGFFSRLEKLLMYKNPFWCTCDQKWFINLLRTNITAKMPGWPTHFTCDYPDHLRFIRLSEYYPNDYECRPWNILSIIIIIVSSTAMFVFFGVIVLLRCQVNIRNALYFVRSYRRIKQGYVKLESSEDFEFDAFVVYCDADRKWVHDVLMNKLESGGLKICIHHRDFDIGEPITNNIEKYMNKSWKVIVVMSNNFAKSEWCQWELDLVQERRRQKGKEAIVLIMYSEIDYKHMTSPLRTLLHTTPHLIFKEGFGEQLFWKTVIREINKSLCYPPAALA